MQTVKVITAILVQLLPVFIKDRLITHVSAKELITKHNARRRVIRTQRIGPTRRRDKDKPEFVSLPQVQHFISPNGINLGFSFSKHRAEGDCSEKNLCKGLSRRVNERRFIGLNEIGIGGGARLPSVLHLKLEPIPGARS